MFIPLYDGVALKYLDRAIVNNLLIAANVAIFAAMWLGAFGSNDRIDTALGVIPAVLFGTADLASGLALVPPPATLLTGMFLHGSPAHLLGNMIFLWVFGDNVEDCMGSLRYLLFYLACGMAGALVYAFMLPASEGPLIGASAAISGVVAAYLMLYPQVRVFGLVFNLLPLRIPAVYCVGAWIALQIVSALAGDDPEIGWWAHVGGIAAGAGLVVFLKRREISLFNPRRE